ncbi:armadillo-type protein [Mycena galopus ATCC 62051]|nr:armadillo-type protein [Mycena galopus ATCC 62051]
MLTFSIVTGWLIMTVTLGQWTSLGYPRAVVGTSILCKSLKEVHLPSALSQTPLDNDLEDHESHFYTSLEHWQQLNLAPAFIKFAQRAGPLSASMPLLLHNWEEIMQLWVVALDESDDEGLRAVLDLLQKITHDLRMTLSPVYLDPILPRLLALLLRSKTISAPALTALLATFAALFKFLLIPASSSSELELLEKTWTSIRDILPRCLPEVQRTMAEVWGGVLRRLKPEAKERAVTLLAESVTEQGTGEIQDAVAWCVVYACKSVSQTLHTCTPSIILPLLNYHLSAPPLSSADPTPRTYSVLRRLFTALIHHVRNAENFASVGDVLVNKFISLVQGTAPLPDDDLEILRRMMDLISIPAAVRNGSRLTQNHATALIAAFPSVLNISLAAPSPHMRAALLRLATALLTASPEANPHSGWARVARFWTQCGMQLGWAGWRAIGVPVFLRMSTKVISAKESSEELQRKTVGLVAELWRTKKLSTGDGDVVWRNCMESWGVKKLREMAGSVCSLSWDQVTLLTDILSISSFFSQSSGFSPVLVELCEALLAPEMALPLYHPARVILEWENLELTKWVKTCTTVGSQCAVSPDILEALAALLTARNTTEIDIEEIYPALAPAVLSHSRALRLGALRLLAATRSSDAREVVKRCLAGEEVPLEVQGVRERVLRIGRVETVVKDKQRETDVGPDLCGRWLVAQLKVNLRPLWSPAAGALAQMAQRFGDEIWRMVFEELQTLYSSSPPNDSDNVQVEQMDVEEQTGKEDKDPWEEERTWRDPSAHKLRTVVDKWLNAQHRMKELEESQNRGDRLDVQTYEAQLLFALGECPALVQKHHRDMVPFFLDLATPGPDGLRSSDTLRELYIANLSHPDRTLQSIALSCILAYKSPVLRHISEKQQIGFIGLLRDVIRHLGPRLVQYWPALLGTTMDFIGHAQARINSPGRADEEEDDVDADDEEDIEEPTPATSASKILRSIRQHGLKRIADFFRCPVQFDYTPYMQAAFSAFISPRLASLDRENTQAPQRTKGTAAVSSPLGQRQIGILSEIAQYSTDASQASTLLTLFHPLLRKPPKVVPEKVKVDLLNIIGTLMPLIPDLSVVTSEIHIKTYELLSQLFQSLRSRSARISLAGTFRRLSLLDPSLESLAETLDSLNAYSTRRMDEPDFDQWLPIIYSMLHSIQDPAELTIRNNAAFTMRHFVDLVAARDTPEFETMFTRVLFSGLKNGLRSKNELVRSEILGVIAYAVTKCEAISFLQEMRVLLAGGDEEANFFNNIHHIQIHRRSRALRRLADQCDEGHLRSNTLAEIFVPLVGNYISATSSVDHHLVNEAILTTGRMAKHLAWGAYYALVQKYLRLSRAKDASERVYVRTLVSLLDNFHFPMEQAVPMVEAVEDEGEQEDVDAEEDVPTPPIPAPLNSTARIADAVNLRLLPNLLNHLEKRDPTTEDTTRIPIAIGIVKVAKYLPATTREPQISRLLTVLSQVLRSKSQETRDLTRDTLSRIAVTLGPSYLPLMLREMRAALLRGPQLHVLAYVTHALLVHVSSEEHSEAFGTLDDCVSDVAYVSAEVIFGESAKDVLAEEFKTKMREVRTSSAKGLDSFGIIAKYITPPRISSLLVPLRAIMQETESVKVIQLVEDVLKRVTSGLNANKHLIPTELLVLCACEAEGSERGCYRTVETPAANETDHYANNSFRFVTFGLDLFSTALRRNRLDFHDPEIIKRLESMVVVIGNTLYSSSSPVLVFGLRAAAGIIKCPLKNLEKSLPVFVAFKSLAAMLRDGPALQASVFAMLRAIVARKFIVPEIYDVMDKVADIMVTTQSPQVQELCRSVLLQFLLDYPQGKGRLRNQMSFLAKNLSYEYESGRKSVLELLGAVLANLRPALDGRAAHKNLFSRLDDERRRVILSHLHSWASQSAQPQLTRVSSQVYGLVVDVMEADASPYLPGILEDVDASLERSSQQLAAIENTEEDRWTPSRLPQPGDGFRAIKWAHNSAFAVSPRVGPDSVLQTLGTLFTAVPPPHPMLESSPISSLGLKDVAAKLCTQLKSEHLDEALMFYAVPVAAPNPLEAEQSDDDEAVEDAKDLNPLPWLFSKLSYQIGLRILRDAIDLQLVSTPLAVLRWFAAMAAHMDAERLEKFLVHILTPTYRLAEDDTIRDPQMDELKTLCIELQDLVQSKVGTTKFSAAYNQIRQACLACRGNEKRQRCCR